MKKNTTIIKPKFRIATASKKPTRLFKSRQPVRLAFVALAGAFIALSAFAIIAKAARPYMTYYGQTRDIKEVRQQTAAAEAENRRLKNDIRYLQTPKGMETEARKLGYLKTGEVAVVFEKPKASEDAKSSGKINALFGNVSDKAKQVLGKDKPKQ